MPRFTLNRPVLVLAGASLIVAIAMGIRQDFGLLLGPITVDRGWTVGTVSLGFAIQQLAWGLAGPALGVVADTRGARDVGILGGVLYATGLLWMALAPTPLQFHLAAGVLVGAALGATGFSIMMGAVARAAPEAKRGFYLGLAGAGGSFGMFIFVPLGQWLIGTLGAATALLGLALLALLMVPLSFLLPGSSDGGAAAGSRQPAAGPGLAQTMRLAFRHDGFFLLMAGFFVCGFHVAFLGVHLPAYLASCGLPASIGAASLALIGFFNIFGSLAAGHLGGRHRPRNVLVAVYALRGLVIVGFILLPKSAASALIFAALMGGLWLSTVPLTSGVVAGIFGPRYVATLFGFVMLSHQLGAFLGAWAGGAAFDATGSYDPVWWISVALAGFAALVHLVIRDARHPAYATA